MANDLHSLQDCLDNLKPRAIEAFDLANNAYDNSGYKKTLTDIRISLEYICKGIYFHSSMPLPTGFTSLGHLINKIGDQQQFDSLDSSKNDQLKEKFKALKNLGNTGAHASTATLKQCEKGKVEFREIIEWFYSTFLTISIPTDLVQVMNKESLNPSEKTEALAYYKYYNKLKEEYNGVVLNDSKGMTLAHTYIQPNVNFWEKSIKNNINQHYHEKNCFSSLEDLATVQQLIASFIDNSINNSNDLIQNNAKMLLVFGYPGQGKTSLCKKLQNQYITLNPNLQGLKNNNFFSIKLRDIDSVQDLFNNPLTTLLDHIKEHEGLTLDAQHLADSLLVLDGLDELAMREQSKQSDIEDFIKELLKKQESRPNLKIIITSRHGYLNLDKFHKAKLIITELGRLNQTQQLDWLSKYKVFHPEATLTEEKIKAINVKENEQYRHLKELIDQPILLHLIASIDLDLDSPNNRAAIYDKLFDNLIDRTWSDRAQISALANLEKEDLREYLQEVAMAIFQSEHEYIRQSDLEKLPATKEFAKKLEKDDLSSVLKHLMIAFYMQDVKKAETDKDDEDKRNYAIEFLHKSLQEYLVAEKIWWKIDEFTEKKKRKGFAISTSEQALKLVFELFAPKLLSDEIQEYLIQIIENDTATDKELIFDRFHNFAPDLLEQQFLLIDPKYTFLKKKPIHAALNTFRGYWVVFAAITEGKNTIPESKDTFIKILELTSTYVYQKWDLSEANLSKTNLTEVILCEANLIRTNLMRAYLIGVDLSSSNLTKANLAEANLMRANLVIANLTEASLMEADLTEASLMEADLSGADLSGADLSGADLSGADLIETDLTEAFLRKTDLTEAILKFSRLIGADLTEADLTRVNLREADLRGANLTRTIITLQQLKTCKSLYKTRGIPEEWILQLKAEGYAHLFEASKYNFD